jgi:hypothetical protein
MVNSNCNCAMSVIKKPCPKDPFSCNRCQTKLKNGGKVWRATVPGVSGHWVVLDGFSTNLEYDQSYQYASEVDNSSWSGNEDVFPDRPPEFVANAVGYKPCYSGVRYASATQVSTSAAAKADYLTGTLESWDALGPARSRLALNVNHYYGDGWRAVLTMEVLGFYQGLLGQTGNDGRVVLSFGALYRSSMSNCFITGSERFTLASAGFDILVYPAPYPSSWVEGGFTPGSDVSAIAHLQVPEYIDFTHVDIS